MPTRTPVRFGAPQRVSLVPADAPGLLSAGIGLFFTFDEFMDVVKRWPSAPGRSPFSLQRDACLYLLSVTNGHPAAVTGLLDYIYEVCDTDKDFRALVNSATGLDMSGRYQAWKDPGSQEVPYDARIRRRPASPCIPRGQASQPVFSESQTLND
jgi:hypothetical protein